MTPRVSVVVPAYQNADYIEQTVDSVLAQTYEDYEVVVADHASSDGTWERLQKYADDPRVRLLRTEAGGGAKRNWDRVSQAARGELVKLVCGDDIVYPTMLERQVAALDAAGSDAVAVASRRDLVDGQGAVFLRARGLQGLCARMPGPAAIRAIVRSGGNPLGEPACVLLRRDVLERVGWWNDDQPYYIDAGTYARVLVHGDLVTVPEPLAAFRVSAGQWSVRLARQQHRQATQFNRAVRTLVPDAVSDWDVRLGDVRAWAAALQRRLAYIWLGSRMRPRS